jgi:hypothetical protein
MQPVLSFWQREKFASWSPASEDAWQIVMEVAFLIGARLPVEEIEANRLESPQGFRVSFELLCIYRFLVYPCHILSHRRDISPCYIQ